MSRHENCGSPNVVTRKSVQQPNKRPMVPSKHHNPVTVSEKLNNLEKKFESVIAELKLSKDELVDSRKEIKVVKDENVELRAQLGTVMAELQWAKDQLVDSKKEIAEMKDDNVDLRAQLAGNNQLIKNVSTEMCNLKKKIEKKGEDIGQNFASSVGIVGVNLPKRILQKLPCKTVEELILLKEDLKDLDTRVHIVSISLCLLDYHLSHVDDDSTRLYFGNLYKNNFSNLLNRNLLSKFDFH